MSAYLAGFVIYWATLTIYLMVFAATLRAPVEVCAFGSAVLMPRKASSVRSVLETTSGVVYYGGVPAAVALRFLPW